MRMASAIYGPAVGVDPLEVPTYRTIAARAKQLRELGMDDRAIAGSLGVSDKTIAEALERLEIRTGHAGSEGAHRTLRYQRAALPAGQFSMTPTASYPSRS